MALEFRLGDKVTHARFGQNVAWIVVDVINEPGRKQILAVENSQTHDQTKFWAHECKLEQSLEGSLITW